MAFWGGSLASSPIAFTSPTSGLGSTQTVELAYWTLVADKLFAGKTSHVQVVVAKAK